MFKLIVLLLAAVLVLQLAEGYSWAHGGYIEPVSRQTDKEGYFEYGFVLPRFREVPKPKSGNQDEGTNEIPKRKFRRFRMPSQY